MHCRICPQAGDQGHPVRPAELVLMGRLGSAGYTRDTDRFKASGGRESHGSSGTYRSVV